MFNSRCVLHHTDVIKLLGVFCSYCIMECLIFVVDASGIADRTTIKEYFFHIHN